MTLTSADIGSIVTQVVAALRKEPSGLLFRIRGTTPVYAVNIVAGTKRHISSEQSRLMRAVGIVPLDVDTGWLDAFTTVTS